MGRALLWPFHQKITMTTSKCWMMTRMLGMIVRLITMATMGNDDEDDCDDDGDEEEMIAVTICR